jgi:hypothetical protein
MRRTRTSIITTLLKQAAASRNATLLISLLALLLCFFPFPSEPYKYIWGPLFDALHFAFFFALTFPVYFAVSRRIVSPWLVPLFSGAFLLCAASLIELLQPLTGRSANIGDIVNGSLGICFGLLFLLWRDYSRSIAILCLVCGFIVQCWLFLPAWQAIRAALWQNASFPLLAEFRAKEEVLLWEPIWADLQYPNSSSKGLGVTIITRPQVYSGALYHAGFFDWSSYSELELLLENPKDQALPLNLRIDDDHKCGRFDARFNKTFSLPPGRHQLHIPLTDIQHGPKNRLLNTKRIFRLYLFVSPLSESGQFRIVKLRLNN